MREEAFADRLKILMEIGDEKRPCVWPKKVGIEMGLFQYYWQKGKANLIKIQNYAGCSIDWLLTGKTAQVEVLGLKFKKAKGSDAKDIPFIKDVALLRKIYNSGKTRKALTVHSVLACFDDGRLSRLTHLFTTAAQTLGFSAKVFCFPPAVPSIRMFRRSIKLWVLSTYTPYKKIPKRIYSC
jgi:hypothetical protein